MANVLRLLGCCFLSMLFVLELFAWLCGFGINLPLFIVCSIGLVVLLVYTTYDILSIKEDNEFLQDRYKNIERIYTDANIERNNLMIENEQLSSMYREACAENRKLNNSIQEYEQEVKILQEEIVRLEGNNE